jgi:hypothetical protein
MWSSETVSTTKVKVKQVYVDGLGVVNDGCWALD